MSPFTATPPLALYVHIPWCIKKCPYCDFNSHPAGDSIPEADYVDQLLADLERDAAYARGRQFQSVFFGGGTPSLFSGGAIGRVLEAADRLVGLAASTEITLEANPGTVEQRRFSDYRAAGVNRLSIGAQSLQDRQLTALGRIHNSDEVRTAMTSAQRTGFDNINVDLMHGLPGQDRVAALADLEGVMDFAPAHISWYQLTIERNTHFYSAPPALPDEDQLAAIEKAGWQCLADGGYGNYEVSAFSQPGRRARHNLIYWQFGDYIGIGAGAHGKLTDEAGRVYRTRKTRQPNHYLAADFALTALTPVEGEVLAFEFMLNALRLTEGVDTALFSQRTGLPMAGLEPALTELRRAGLLEPDPARLCTTALGRRFLDDVLSRFMPD